MEETYTGQCHCGTVRFRATLDLALSEVCNCSMCTKKGFVHAVISPDKFELLSGADALSTYTFNTGIAKHTFCRHCGIHAFYTPRSHPDKVDVNVRCLDGVDMNEVHPRPFDGKNWEAAMAARGR